MQPSPWMRLWLWGVIEQVQPSQTLSPTFCPSHPSICNSQLLLNRPTEAVIVADSTHQSHISTRTSTIMRGLGDCSSGYKHHGAACVALFSYLPMGPTRERV